MMKYILILLSISLSLNQGNPDSSRSKAFTICNGLPSLTRSRLISSDNVSHYAQVYGIDIFASGWTTSDFQFLLGNIAFIFDQGEKGCVDDPKLVQALTQNGNSSSFFFMNQYNIAPNINYFTAYSNVIVVKWADVQPPSTSYRKGQFTPVWYDKTLEKVLSLIYFGLKKAYPNNFDGTNQWSQLYIQTANAIAQGSYQIPLLNPLQIMNTICDVECIVMLYFVNVMQAKMGAFNNMASAPPNCYIKKDGNNNVVLNSTSLKQYFPDTHNLLSYSPSKSKSLGPNARAPGNNYLITMNLTNCNKPVIANMAANYTCSSVTALNQLSNQTATQAQVNAAQSSPSAPQAKINFTDLDGPTMSFRICGGLPVNKTQQSGLTDTDKVGYYAQVFGVEIFAHQDWSLDMFQDILGRVAQMFDNDQSGCTDDPKVNQFLGNFGNRVGLFLMGRNGTLPNPAWKSFYKWSSIIQWDDVVPPAVLISTAIQLNQKDLQKKKKGAISDLFIDRSTEKILQLLFFGLKNAYPSQFNATSNSSLISIYMKSSKGNGNFIPPTSNNQTGINSTCDQECQAVSWFVNIVQTKLGLFDYLTTLPYSVKNGRGGVQNKGQVINSYNINSSLPEVKQFLAGLITKLGVLKWNGTGYNRAPNGKYKPKLNVTGVASCGIPLITNTVGLYQCGDTITGVAGFLKYLQSSGDVSSSETVNEPISEEVADTTTVKAATELAVTQSSDYGNGYSGNSGTNNQINLIFSIINIIALTIFLLLQ